MGQQATGGEVGAEFDGQLELAPDCRLWCRDTGGPGAVVVLAHPQTGNHLSWSAQIPALVDRGFRVIAWSRRGYHGSSAFDPANPGTQAGDLAALLDLRGVKAAHLVGVAAGGATVLDFALTYPARARSLAVVSSLMGLDEPGLRDWIATLRSGWFQSLPPEVKELGPSYRGFCPDGVDEWKRIRALNPAMELPKNTRFLQQPTGTAISIAGLAASSVPMLLMTGAADTYMPPRLLRQIAAQLPAARVRVFEEAAHAPHVETPAEFNAALVEFLGSLRG